MRGWRAGSSRHRAHSSFVGGLCSFSLAASYTIMALDRWKTRSLVRDILGPCTNNGQSPDTGESPTTDRIYKNITSHSPRTRTEFFSHHILSNITTQAQHTNPLFFDPPYPLPKSSATTLLPPTISPHHPLTRSRKKTYSSSIILSLRTNISGRDTRCS